MMLFVVAAGVRRQQETEAKELCDKCGLPIVPNATFVNLNGYWM